MYIGAFLLLAETIAAFVMMPFPGGLVFLPD
ncbi:MAG: hypothetical protein UX72_C0010G0029 [Parcubacteria group bacterium GW2011_GWA2_47_10]|nr:MAG: hypothetical protein UX72_C0010G0029 [Parcubacteria group bacterium GW2011_GWA2_47_10]